MKRFSPKNRELAAKNMNFLIDTLDKSGVVPNNFDKKQAQEPLPELENIKYSCGKCLDQALAGKTVCSYCRNTLSFKPAPVVQEIPEAVVAD